MSGRVSQQTKAEREALIAAWFADPRVIAWRAAMSTFIEERQLTFTVGGFNALFEFTNAWNTEHGYLPDSGIASE